MIMEKSLETLFDILIGLLLIARIDIMGMTS